MVFVKPVSRAKYYLAKAITYYTLTIGSMLIGMGITAYYTELLFGKLDWAHVWLGTFMYIPNLLLVVTTTLCASSFFANAVGAGERRWSSISWSSPSRNFSANFWTWSPRADCPMPR